MRTVRKRTPTWLAWLIVLLLPLLGVALLLPEVMAWLRGIKDVVLGGGRAGVHPADYVIHGLMAMGLAVLVIVAWPMSSTRPRLHAAAALLVLLALAPLIEIVQHYTGRGLEAEDARSHIIGVNVAMVWWAFTLTRSPHLCTPMAELPRESA